MKRGFVGWYEWQVEKKRRTSVLDRALARLSTATTAAAFDGWLDSTREAQRKAAALVRAVRFMQKAGMAAAFGGWTACTAERVHNLPLLQMSGCRRSTRGITRASQDWVE